MTKKERLSLALGHLNAEEYSLDVTLEKLADQLTQNGVDAVCALLRAARRAGRAEEQESRRKHREGRRRDPGQLGADTQRMVVSGLGKRAAIDLDALSALQELFDSERDVMTMAVAGLRTRYSDTEIGIALGLQPDYARQEVGRRFGRRGTQEEPERDSAVAEWPTR